MKRNALKDLEKWLKDDTHTHLYVTGMRGTGKTALIKVFIENNAGNRYIYVNFETDFEIRKFFSENIGRYAESDFGRYITSDHPDTLSVGTEFHSFYHGSIAGMICSYYDLASDTVRPDYIILDEIHALSVQVELFLRAIASSGNSQINSAASGYEPDGGSSVSGYDSDEGNSSSVSGNEQAGNDTSAVNYHKSPRLIFIDSENTVSDQFFENNPLIYEKFKRIHIFPLTFDEFLINTGREWYHDVIVGHYERMRPVPELVNNEINDILSDYLVTGGMPEIVSRYIQNGCSLRDLGIEEFQKRELRNITGALEEYCDRDYQKINAILEASVSQRIEDSRHFVFSRLIKGTSYSYYASAIEKLCDSGILLKATFDGHFRFYWADTGLLGMKIRTAYICDQDVYDEILAGNFIAQHLAAQNRKMEYWCSDNSSKVDIVLSDQRSRIPVKYVGTSKRRVRSLQIYEKETASDEKIINEMIAVTDSDFYIMGHLKFIPLYAVFCLNI